MGQWAAVAPPATLERLGLRRGGAFALVKAPSADTIRRVVNSVLPGGLEQLLRAFEEKASVVAVDGKCLRGARDAAGQAVMVLGAMLQDGTLVAQQKVADKGSEITGFAALLAALELEDAVVVADALYTQREHARVLGEEFGAHYAFGQAEPDGFVGGVPEGALGPGAGRLPLHGARPRPDRYAGVEVVSFAGLDFPYARQGARITRYRTVRASGKRSLETVYVITDLSSSQADPQRIGEIVQSEIHYVRDVTFGEDASRTRTGHGPQNMATLRSVAMNFLRRMGASIADTRRQLALAPHTAPLDLFGIPCDAHVHA